MERREREGKCSGFEGVGKREGMTMPRECEIGRAHV